MVETNTCLMQNVSWTFFERVSGTHYWYNLTLSFTELIHLRHNGA